MRTPKGSNYNGMKDIKLAIDENSPSKKSGCEELMVANGVESNVESNFMKNDAEENSDANDENDSCAEEMSDAHDETDSDDEVVDDSSSPQPMNSHAGPAITDEAEMEIYHGAAHRAMNKEPEASNRSVKKRPAAIKKPAASPATNTVIKKPKTNNATLEPACRLALHDAHALYEKAYNGACILLDQYVEGRATMKKKDERGHMLGQICSGKTIFLQLTQLQAGDYFDSGLAILLHAARLGHCANDLRRIKDVLRSL